jgi:predicted GNAT superfamily acetyltransferase
MTDNFTIRPLTTHTDFHACEEVQRQAWQMADLEIVPLHMLITVARNGGVVLGAFNGDQMVGCVFGFLGTTEGYEPESPATVRLKHCSHMLAVLPEWRSRGVGYALKLAQREGARAQGLRLMTWTYDPLESRNAHLNIARLGAVCNTYIRDLYGVMDDALNRGLFTDRFRVDWHIASKRVATRLERGHQSLNLEHFTSAGADVLNPARWGESSVLPRPGKQLAPSDTSMFLVEIPPDFQAIKRADNSLALEWRLHTRHIFETAFRTGYTVIDFIHTAGRSMYVLAHTGTAPAPWSIFADDIVDTGERET